MARSTPNATILQTLSEEPDYDYAEAAAALDVGDLAELTSSETIQPHQTAAEEKIPARVAIEARENGMVADDPDDAKDNYASGNLAKYITCDGGEHLLVNLAAGGDLATSTQANITEGDRLVSAGTESPGKVRKIAGGTSPDPDTATVFVARESLDNSAAAAGEFAKLRAEVVS